MLENNLCILKEKFSRIRSEKGLKAAIEWRDNRFTHQPK